MGTVRDDTTPRGLRVLRMPETIARTGRSRAQLYRLIAAGAFPRPIRLGANSIAFDERAVDQWIADRIAGKPLPATPMTATARARLEERRAARDAGAACRA